MLRCIARLAAVAWLASLTARVHAEEKIVPTAVVSTRSSSLAENLAAKRFAATFTFARGSSCPS